MEGLRPVVAIWKSTWLPTSQTFVYNQISALSRWQPLLLGVRRLPDGLPVTPDSAPFGRSLAWRVVHKASAATGYRRIYDGRLRRSGARLVHAHFGTSAVSVLPVVRRLRLPLVVTFHGFDVTSETLRRDPGSARYVRRLGDVFAYADTLLAVSEFIASQLVRLGAPEHKIRVHHIGLPVTAQIPKPGRRSGVAFVGRLVDVKGVGDLIAALGMLPPALRTGLPVTVVGSGPLSEDLRRQAAKAGVAVDFTGYLSPAEVAGVLRRSAIFCGPSKTSPRGDTEAFGIVFLEAALHGLPVVAYRHGGVSEAVQDGRTGLLAPEGDVAALAAHLRRLLESPQLAAELGAAGRARVLADFDVVRQTRILEDLYDEVAARAGATPE